MSRRPSSAPSMALILALAGSACSRAGFEGAGVGGDGSFVPSAEAACQAVTCEGHGACGVAPDGTARCLCDPGYRAEGLRCVAVPASACAGVDCGASGRCGLGVTGTPQCVCDPGAAIVDGGGCAALVSPCQGVDCGVHGSCVRLADGAAACACAVGSGLVAGVCAPVDAGGGG